MTTHPDTTRTQKSTTASWLSLVLSLAVGLSSGTCLAQEKRPWTVEDTFRLSRIGDLQASPDGGELVFVVSGKNLQENASTSSIWKWSEDAGRAVPLTARDGSASSPRWSPDGDRIAYFSSDEGSLGLWTMRADGSGKTLLTHLERSNVYLTYGGPDNELAWSPDGKRLAFSAAGPAYYENDIDPPHLPTGNDVMIIDRLLHKAAYYYSDLRRTHIWTIPAGGGEAEQLTSGDTDYHSFSWSPDGRYIACVSNQTGMDDFNANNDILLIDTRSGEATQVSYTSSPEYQVDWSPDGARLAYYGRERAGRSKESDAELIKLYTMDPDGENVVNLSGPVDRWVEGFQWAPNSERLYFSIQNEGRVELYTVAADGGDPQSLIREQGQVGDFAVAEDGTIYYVFSSMSRPDEIWRAGPDGRGGERLTAFNAAFVNEVQILDAEHFSYNSFDGLRIDGWVMRPSGFDESKSYPLVLGVHGGPHGQYGYGLSAAFQELAASGYAVLFTNPRGSTGRGQAFSDEVVGDIAGGDYQDIMTGLDYAIGRYDFIDSDHMGVTGTSYGGYLTNWITTHTHRFDAAVPVSGISNLITQWSAGANFLWYESDMEVMPFEDYEQAWDVSPLKYIHGASTPTLFINGRWDFITSLSHANAMFMALKKLGVDTQIALYPEEGHGVHRQPKHTADYHARRIAWFDKYLK